MRVLFVAENVTLAQVVRLVVLANGLRHEHEVHFACSTFDELVFRGTSFRRWPIASIPKATVERAIASGKRIYDERTLRRYVDDDLRVLDAVKPDVVVGDLRTSLAIAAPLRGIPCASLVNAYWSPRAVREGFPLPEHPIVRLLGVETAARYFPKALPFVFDHFAEPVNRLRRERGLSPIGSLPEVLTWGDATLHPDVPGLVPIRDEPAGHVFLGPVLWSPDVPMPPDAAALGRRRPLVYVTLGSSGSVEVVPRVLAGLSSVDVDVLLATAERFRGDVPPNVIVAPYVPGDEAARRASVVVSNGGSSTGWQALREGTPVLGIPYNLDQYLATDSVVRAGAGLSLRSGTLTARAVAEATTRLLEEPSFRAAARKIADEMATFDVHARFRAALGALHDRSVRDQAPLTPARAAPPGTSRTPRSPARRSAW